MPELEIKVGGRSYRVACEDGEELHLRGAAATLNAEAETVVESAGQIPESRMLLMAGLLLADKMAAIAEYERVADEKVRAMEKRLALAEKRAEQAKLGKGDLFEGLRTVAEPETPASDEPEPVPAPQSTGPDLERLAALAEELEALAEELEGGAAA